MEGVDAMTGETVLSPVRSTIDLAAELRRLLSATETRAGKSISRVGLARRVGVSQSSLYAYLNGSTLIPADALSALLRALNANDLDVQRIRRVRASMSGPATPIRPVLPVDVDTFAARTEYLAELDRLRGRVRKSGSVGIVTLSGIGGIGKTTLALHWAHQRLSRFPDGCLYLDLRGFHPDCPLEPAEALAVLLRRLGIPEADVPVGLEERRDRYQQALAGKRMLILLDNARSHDQVRSLLPPGTSRCFVLVTSRDQLSGLVVSHGAQPLSVGELSTPGARALLSARLGPDRVNAEPDAVDGIIAACGRLPLALSIVAGRAQIRPRLSLTDLAAELEDSATTLSALDGGDPATSVRTVLSWSLASLTPQQARLFALLGTAPGNDISLAAAAGLADLPSEEAKAVLVDLERVSLVSEHARGRFRMHDLVRGYAAGTARHSLGTAAWEAALRRVVTFYLRTARAADRTLDPYRPQPELAPRVSAANVELLGDAPAAMAWFDNEHSNLLAAQRAAARQGWHLLVWHLTHAVSTFQQRRCRHEARLAMRQIALESARQLSIPTLSAHAHKLLARAYADLGRRDEASEHFEAALAMAESHGDLTQQAIIQMALTDFRARPGKTPLSEDEARDRKQALNHAGRSLKLFRAIGNPVGEAYARYHMGFILADLGKFAPARKHCEAALGLFRAHSDATGESCVLECMGYIEHRDGRHRAALRHLERALELAGDEDNTAGSASVLEHLGAPYVALGRAERARRVWRTAFDLYRRHGLVEEATRVRDRLDDLDRSGPSDEARHGGRAPENS